MTNARFRQSIAEGREEFKSGTPHYPARMKRFAVEWARVALANGATLTSVACKPSTSDIALSEWVQAAEVGAAFASVGLEAAERPCATGELTLTTQVRPHAQEGRVKPGSLRRDLAPGD